MPHTPQMNQYQEEVTFEASEITIGKVELKDGAGTETASIKPDGGPISASPDSGGLLISGRDGALQRHVRVTAAGALIVSTSSPTPGATITSPVDVAVGVAAVVPLPAPPAGTTEMTVQNTSVGATVLRVRELGGAAGAGIMLPRFSVRTFSEAVAPLEVEHVAGPAGSAAIQFEGP